MMSTGKLRHGVRGRRPDFIISVKTYGYGTVMELILVEVKISPIDHHMAQLAAYAAKVGTCAQLKERVVLSILIGRLGFSACMDKECRSLPLLRIL